MGSARADAINNSRKRAANRNFSKYYYVDNEKLERMGIKNYKIKDGPNYLAILPPLDEKALYCRDVFIHYHVGADDSVVVCQRRTEDPITGKKWNKPCPICEYMDEELQKNAKDPKALALRPSCRCLFFVVDVTDPETQKKGIHWMDAPPTVRDGITGISVNRRSGGVIDVADPDEGKNVVFDRTGKELQTRYTSFQLEDRDPIPDAWLEVPTFDEILKSTSYEEIAEEFFGTPVASAEEDDIPSTANVAREGRRGSVLPSASQETVKEDEGVSAEEAPKNEVPRRAARRPVEENTTTESVQKEENAPAGSEKPVSRLDEIRQRIRNKKV